ncbi:LemA family protein [Acholeplasma equirhinis]|uniref:LemA family protein n=1 Tax=Acholeplasma equirhinis TaxID=555393 RepID=UPI00197A759C|nr:LemA family protein [Acholeplasma equirhinis]MBN3490685.1 LemA family protein [Acholeplasma equirhinis]
MDVLLIVLGIILVLALIFFGWYISTLNSFRQQQVKIDEAESSIDVALTKRFDLLTKMVSATKGYMKHEQETLAKVISMRQPARNASIAEKQEFANALTQGMSQLNVVVEQYPDLKASQNFLSLQNATMEVEENLQAARRVYNSNVSVYNQNLVTFPASLVAGWKKFTKRDFFEAEVAKRQDVDFNF